MGKKILLVLFALAVLVPSAAWGETWKVNIPSGAGVPTVPSHYVPKEITIRINDIVEWANGDTLYHTVTSGSMETGPTNVFDSNYIPPGGKFSYKFDETFLGENKYFCTIHPWLGGIVNVAEIEAGFKTFHNVGEQNTVNLYDVYYKVERTLVTITVDKNTNSIVFNLAGKIDNDNLTVNLSNDLIKNPKSILVNNKKIINYSIDKQGEFNIISIPLDFDSNEIRIAGDSVLAKPIKTPGLIEDQIFASLDKSSYVAPDDVIVSGEIMNPKLINQVSIQVVSPSGKIVYEEVLSFIVDSKFTTKISSEGIFKEAGRYDLKIMGDDSKVLIKTFEYDLGKNLPPKKQMMNKVLPEDVVCNKGLHLMKRVFDGSAVCLKESTSSVLLERGWADFF